MPTACAVSLHDPATDGTSMKRSLESTARLHYLWRAVDQEGDVLDILVESRRDKKAAKKFFRKLLKELRYVPRMIITDKLKSYSAARAELMPSVEHLQQKYQNNRAENSHQPTRLRAGDEAVQVGGPRAALSLGLRDHHVPLPTGTTLLYRRRLSPDDEE
jgi:hypothetical protein